MSKKSTGTKIYEFFEHIEVLYLLGGMLCLLYLGVSFSYNYINTQIRASETLALVDKYAIALYNNCYNLNERVDFSDINPQNTDKNCPALAFDTLGLGSLPAGVVRIFPLPNVSKAVIEPTQDETPTDSAPEESTEYESLPTRPTTRFISQNGATSVNIMVIFQDDNLCQKVLNKTSNKYHSSKYNKAFAKEAVCHDPSYREKYILLEHNIK